MGTVAATRSTDPRAERSRTLLLEASIRLIAERGTTELPLTELVRAAGVSRQVAYLHYADRDELVLEAAVHLMRTELTSATPTASARQAVERVTEHFAAHRDFYRAVLTGPCCYAFNQRMLALLRPFTLLLVPHVSGQAQLDAAEFLAGGAGAIIAGWVIDRGDPSTPLQVADRITAARRSVTSMPHPTPPGLDEEHR